MKLALMKSDMVAAFEYVKNKLFSEKTYLIYDHVIQEREDELPTVREILMGFPDPCGYSTGMEDGMINGGTMLDACLIKYECEKDADAAELAKKIAKGMLNCAFSAKSEGFLPRAVSLEDGKTHYPDSSRDQYTMFAFGLHRYLTSSLCTSDEKEQIIRATVAIARRAEQNVTWENNYDMLTDNGSPTLVTTMWGDTLANHEYMRLPMLYLLAYESSGDTHWLEKYREIREEAYQKSLPMHKYWALYTLQQMQASIRVCYDIEPDEEWRARYLFLMNEVADYAEGLVSRVRERMDAYQNYNAAQPSFREIEPKPSERFIKLGYKGAVSTSRPDASEFFALQDCAQISIITKLVPNRYTCNSALELLFDAFCKIDLSRHERNLPLFFIDAYYRSTL